MSKVRICTHSGSDMPADLAKELGIIVIPDVVVFQMKEYVTGVDIDEAGFYKLLGESQKIPTTAHPSTGVFIDTFSSEDCDELICFTVSGKMSSTFATAQTAKHIYDEDGAARPRVYIYDSYQVSFGMTMLVLAAARLAKKGLGADEIIQEVDKLRGKTGVYFLLSSLKAAQKSGRISAVKAVTADLLGVKPVLMLDDGFVSDVEIARNFPLGLQAIGKYYGRQAEKGGECFVFHACNPEGAELLRAQVAAIDPEAKIRVEWLGPAIGANTGAGCVGMSFWKKD